MRRRSCIAAAAAATLLAGCAQAHAYDPHAPYAEPMPYFQRSPMLITPPWMPHPATGGFPGALPANRVDPPVRAVPVPLPPPGVAIPSNCVRASLGEMRCIVPD